MKRTLYATAFLASALLGAADASAYDFQYGDLFFNILSEDMRTVEVSYKSAIASSQADYVVGELEIPDRVIYFNRGYNVVSIGRGAFRNCTAITSLRIGPNVETIEDWAFHNCSALESLSLEGNLTTIGAGAFYNCDSLTEISFGTSLTTLRNWAFSGCDALESVSLPESVTAIGTGAFFSCHSLREVTTGNSLTSLGGGTFRECPALTSVILGDGVDTIGDKIFTNSTALRSLYCMASIPPEYSGDFPAEVIAEATLYVPAGRLREYASTYPWSSFRNIEESTSPGDATGVRTIAAAADSDEAEVWSVAGQPLYRGPLNGLQPLPPGLYIIRSGENATKVILP